ncbi:MAG: ribosome biogenesis GTPase Der [Planctomycetes bacterium]|nr:ribosome biogenesis GTPase Der [Planctomycetota bacterium]
MAIPVVAIVGRPNVGKSSLFNMIARSRIAIVEPTAGVTRDRVSAICEIDEVYFELVDTGGHGVVDRDDLSEDVERQIQYAINAAQLILFVVDARDGLVPLDRDTAELLRRFSDRTRLIANKVDDPRMADETGEFAKLGFGEPLPVSATAGHGRQALFELLTEALSELGNEVPAEAAMKVAVVGKRNAGKSTFINALAGEERVIVSETPGTTRDSIDVRFEKDGRTLVAIDTAGVRKKSRITDDIEFYALTRATGSIQRADVVLLLIDATLPVSQVDKHLAQLVSAEHKPCILVVNKWDLAKGEASTTDYGEYLAKVLPEVDYAPIAFTSANVGRNVDSTIDLASAMLKQSRTRIGTGPLNRVLEEALAANTPWAKRGKKAPKFLYATQVSVQPPTIVVFVNAPRLVTQTYRRFLLNRFRESLPFAEIPIRLMFRARRERSAMF